MFTTFFGLLNVRYLIRAFSALWKDTKGSKHESFTFSFTPNVTYILTHCTGGGGTFRVHVQVPHNRGDAITEIN